MVILQIEHKVQSYDGWKKTFDNDPMNRKKSNVRQFRVYRPVDDPNYVVVDLEFDNISDANIMLIALRGLWGQVEGKVIFSPQTRIMEVKDSKIY